MLRRESTVSILHFTAVDRSMSRTRSPSIPNAYPTAGVRRKFAHLLFDAGAEVPAAAVWLLNPSSTRIRGLA